MPNFMKIRPVGVELFRVDRSTDRQDEANITSFYCQILMKL